MSLSLLQDIHIGDEKFWTDFQYYWNTGNYTRAINILNENQQLATKYLTAEWINALTTLVYQLETVPEWTKKQIKVSYLPPDLEVGDIWFQLEIREIKVNVGIGIIGTGSTSVTVNYNSPEILINAIAYKNNEEIKIDKRMIDSYNGSPYSVEFSIDSAVVNPITCMIFTTQNARVYATTVPISQNEYTHTESYTSGWLLSAMLRKEENNVGEGNSHRILSCDLVLDSSTKDITFNSDVELTANDYSIYYVYILIFTYFEVLNISMESINSTFGTLPCVGYMINTFVTDSLYNVVQTDVEFNADKATIGAPQNEGETLECILYYT